MLSNKKQASSIGRSNSMSFDQYLVNDPGTNKQATTSPSPRKEDESFQFSRQESMNTPGEIEKSLNDLKTKEKELQQLIKEKNAATRALED